MKMLTCAATRRRLQAYHDQELTLGDQVAVAAHLEWCDACAGTLEELRALRDALRASLPGRAALSPEHEVDLREAVINRIRIEDTLSFATWLRESFADMHFVYAGVSAMAAALVCIIVAFGVLRSATNEAPDSPAALVKLLNSPPGSDLNPISVSPLVSLPRALPGIDEPIWEPLAAGDDGAELMLSAVVTREGRVENLEVLTPSGQWIGGDHREARTFGNLLDVASRARFEPASLAGAPVLFGVDAGERLEPVRVVLAVNMVWIVAHTTVRAPKGPQDPVVHRIGKKSAALAIASSTGV